MTAWRLDEAECAELVELLVGLVASPSPDPPGNEAAVAGFLIGWLEERGFDVTRDEFAPDRINVLARLKGDGSKPALIFSVHMDTLPIGDGDWGHPAFGAEIEDGKLYGRGATDMKSGLAAMAAAALKLRRADVALAGDLILAFSAGESSNLLGAERMVEAGNLKGAGALLVSEPTSLGLVTAEAGALWLRVVASGRPGHASAGTADNAILKLMDFLADVRTNPFVDKTNPLLGTATLAINTISGGTAVNLTADRAEATLDIRTIPGLTTADVLARLRAIAGEAIVIDVMDEKPPVVTDPTDPFAETCLVAVQAVRGVRPKPVGVSYFSDSAAFVPALNIPRVIIGPGQIGTSGQRDEWVALDDFATAADIFAKIAVCMLGPD